ncbi:MAG: 23S rRNA (uracil(1939)-C(5))-methyltransferase RlmD [Proteobacteria bacterium]|nr:23S rRNA (uracil(1939)-C(5))-methyltransferase RlmD [Pseudomonadota bacterium]MBI3497947.1 23S rRNA (uracil(1939)-C(5))-methyltransferase RlmD [Pseudomonadota bacterium]
MATRHPRKPASAAGPPVELVIEALGALGDGLARHGGERVFVPFALPGERVTARILGRRADGLEARLIQLSEPAPTRIKPACRHFGSCGGCAAQHLARPAYAAWKRRVVEDALARRGLKDIAVEPPMPIAPGTRRRAELTLMGTQRRILAGFAQHASHTIVDLAECPVLLPAIVALIEPLRQSLAGWLKPGMRAEAAVVASESGLDLVLTLPAAPDLSLRERLAALAQSQDLARLSWRQKHGELELLAGRRPFGTRFGGIWVALPPGAFLQASEAGEALILDEVLSGIGRAKSVADLYAGAGTLSLPLARQARVHAVEGDAALVQALDEAARRLGGKRLSVEQRDLATDPLTAAELARFEAAVFDPPRAGALSQARELALSPVPLVVAVSCHPGSFARDARILVDGGYRLQRVVPIDQFLWSAHIELVAWFRR